MPLRSFGWNQCVHDSRCFGFGNDSRSSQIPALFFGKPVRQMACSTVPVCCFPACCNAKTFFDSFVCFLFGHLSLRYRVV